MEKHPDFQNNTSRPLNLSCAPGARPFMGRAPERSPCCWCHVETVLGLFIEVPKFSKLLSPISTKKLNSTHFHSTDGLLLKMHHQSNYIRNKLKPKPRYIERDAHTQRYTYIHKTIHTDIHKDTYF